MSQPLRVDDFVEELKKYERKEEFMAVMRQYEQRYYDQFEQYANSNLPPELQRQYVPKQDLQWRQQQQIQKPPIVRSNSANKLDYQEPYSVFPQQPYQLPVRPPSRGELQDPFKRPQEQYDFRMNPLPQLDPFRNGGGLNNQMQQQYNSQQKNQPIIQNSPVQMPLFQPFQPTVQPINQVPVQVQTQMPVSFPAQLNAQIAPQLQQYPNFAQQQIFEQPYQQQYTQQKAMPNSQQQMDAFLNEIKSQRMMKQQQQK